ncbi:hypothetical protein FHS18_006497 [Paenibacillus phyllosphaerae]|uniref:Uncharacterized protein n=1 Tax=Paenibacillus phyllosphaerae TaxID=274593 RepID=A0A7W5B5L4_9BACL|nr:hypothetical protein [Paenibacillus phyllosphaerae]MBB3114376.1 hypothetical protein [Paenibacillus phyllosphaerae]
MSVPNDLDMKQLEDELHEPLSRLLVNPVSSGDTARLIRSLQPAFNELKQFREAERLTLRTAAVFHQPSVLRLLRSQLTSYSRMYWLTSLLVFFMLLLILPTGSNVSFHTVGNTFTFVLPALLLASLAYSFRSWNKELRMIESITPYPPAMLLILRTMIVICLNLLFGLAGSIYMNLKVSAFPMLPFMLHWLSLLLLMSGLTAYLMMWRGMKAAFAIAALLWFAWNGLMQRIVPIWEFSYNEYLSHLQTGALVAGLLLLALAYKRSFASRLLP